MEPKNTFAPPSKSEAVPAEVSNSRLNGSESNEAMLPVNKFVPLFTVAKDDPPLTGPPEQRLTPPQLKSAVTVSALAGCARTGTRTATARIIRQYRSISFIRSPDFVMNTDSHRFFWTTSNATWIPSLRHVFLIDYKGLSVTLTGPIFRWTNPLHTLRKACSGPRLVSSKGQRWERSRLKPLNHVEAAAQDFSRF